MKKMLIFWAATLFAGSAFAENINMAVIDVHKIIQQSPQVAVVRAQLKKQFDPQEQKVLDQQKTLQSDIAKYRKDSSVMKATAKKALEKTITDEQQKLQGMQVDLQQKIIAAQNTAMQDVINKIADVVKQIAQKRAINIVFTKASAAYNDESLDITDAVIAELK